ncbi:MAG: ATP-binding protein [Selenomonadaceae bacterium]|nr:ATP-binding protein [Selenomonadaceae bacterium]
MTEVNLGIILVEIITSGLYKNSLDVIREYIQNSCDAIDDAIKVGVLRKNDGKITITIDEAKRKITIEDNGIGLSALTFQKKLSDIGKSDKTLETARGFRGIGRLGGMAYCKTLVFSSKIAGEKKISRLIIDAERLRREFFSDKKRPAEYALATNMSFSTSDTNSYNGHFFRVELIDIVYTNADLLNVNKVRDYLSFIAPVPYSPQFEFRKQIYAHATELGFKITEYDICVNGKPIFKSYKTDVQTTYNGDDKIFGVEFRKVYDDDENLIAWFWFGLSQFKGVLSEKHETDSYKMRGIRLRQKNIQIGDALILRTVFEDDQRGTKYFIGEVHTIDTNLRPNSERDDFEENTAYNNLKSALKKYFVELNELYRTAVTVRTLINAVNAPGNAVSDFQRGRSKFKNREELKDELDRLNRNAIKADSTLAWINWKATRTPDTVSAKFINHVMENQTPFVPPKLPPIDEPSLPFKWRKDSLKLYNAIKEVILANPTIGGRKLLDKINDTLLK